MTDVLAAWPYPWTEPAARQLHRTLTQLFPSPKAAADVAARAGIEVWALDLQQPPVHIWKDVLDTAAKLGLSRALAETVRDLVPATSPARPLVDDLLAARPPRAEAEPVGRDGAPRFLAASDTVSVEEALLYHDSLLLPIGRVPALIGTLRRLLAVAPSVCKLEVALPGGGGTLGTGLRVGPRRILTCWHVLHPGGTPASAVVAEFGYDDDGAGGAVPSTAVRCDPATVTGDPADDWALIGTAEDPGDTWPVVPLDPGAVPRLHGPAYIIQHPGGVRKRLGFVRNHISYVDDRVVQYLTDTQTGSSGAPVLDADGTVIAIHHAGGRPQEVAGRPPTNKNEGIRISRVRLG
ncbi:trypsin-like peptidase domain-containing protein [Dactylosporangium aurantiacum]|uniref:Serine protease n=1 Tax=Dactylosporangium aurantiacum TaxID=35754 RepID=A0A9Q9MM58_9ACTN|nr:serine protease [Dactylosporangium aurantiacum]MDG6103228.1 serine protease [Dactylosporangium aurantiacum]UWZ57731.1 trypsin-like peptidase domain-containing protein [Dactylosporangium aurantiacum]